MGLLIVATTSFTFKANVEFVLAMGEAGIPCQFRVRDGGHTWEYWSTALYQVLPFVSNLLVVSNDKFRAMNKISKYLYGAAIVGVLVSCYDSANAPFPGFKPTPGDTLNQSG
jgi:hypothetical protein